MIAATKPRAQEIQTTEQFAARTTAADEAHDDARVHTTRSGVRLTYQGWSGFIVDVPDDRCAQLVLDPAPDAVLPSTAFAMLITHGHPEHVQGAFAHIRRADREPVQVIASTHVCRYLAKHSAQPADQFHPLAGGESLEVPGWQVRAFGWEHMSLLPPNKLLAVGYLVKLFIHPLRLARVGLASAGGPRHAPMLGFHLTPPSGAPLVYYGEGLHRLTTQEELQGAFGSGRVGTLITAVEPEDTQQLPDMLAPHAIDEIVAFEAHYTWRQQFGMPQIDMPDLLERMRARELQVVALRP